MTKDGNMFDKHAVDKNKWMIDPDDSIMLLIDHQSGLFQLVRDIDQPTLRNHATALAKVAYLANIPTFVFAILHLNFYSS